MTASPRILVAAELASDGEWIRDLLRSEFPQVLISTDPQRSVVDFESQQPQILILAFNRLEKAEAYYLGLHRLSERIHQIRHRTILLCSKDELRKVYELCRRRYFDDYVLFWPMGHDATRLLMSVHHATRDPSPEAAPIAAADAAEPASAPTAVRVLVVDDDPFQHRLVASILAGEAVQLFFTSSGEEAIAWLGSQPADIVLMDVDLPDINGLEATRRLKSLPALAALPVIMVTGRRERDIVVESLNAGAVDFVVKPLDKSVLMTKLYKALGRP